MRSALIAIGLLLPAAVHAQVVFTEVRWAGSELSSADEWFRIRNSSDQSIDLYGWQVTTRKSDGSHEPMVEFSNQQLGAGESLLISNYAKEQSALEEEPDMVTSAVSLPNTKLLLRILNADGAVVDEADDGVGAPFAGSKDPYLSMLRVSLQAPGTSQENWYTAGEHVSSSVKSSSSSSSSVSTSVSSEISSSSESSKASEYAGINGAVDPLPAENSDVRITAIIPKPPSGKRVDQQIFIEYLGGRKANLDGWMLDNRSGGSQPVPLDGITFNANGTQMFNAAWLGISYTPERDTAQLIAPDGTVVSWLSWNNPAPWQTVRPVKESRRRMPVEVVSTEGDTVHVRLTEESFVGLLPRVERYWAQSAHAYLHFSIPLKLTGVTLVRGKQLPLSAGDRIFLDPQHVEWNAQPSISAFVYEEDGSLLQHELLSKRVAVASNEEHVRRVEFTAMHSSSSSSIALSKGSSSNIEQKSYSSTTAVEMLPVKYVHIQPARVQDPRESSRLDSRIVSLTEAKKIPASQEGNTPSNGLPWLLLFGQSAAWLVFTGYKYV